MDILAAAAAAAAAGAAGAASLLEWKGRCSARGARTLTHTRGPVFF
jgi:hypothetical protein